MRTRAPRVRRTPRKPPAQRLQRRPAHGAPPAAFGRGAFLGAEQKRHCRGWENARAEDGDMLLCPYSCRSFLTHHGLDRNCGSVRGTAVTPIMSPVMKGTENVRQRKRNKRSGRYGSEHRSRSSNRYCLISFGERGSLAKAPSRTIHIVFLLSPRDCLCIL